MANEINSSNQINPNIAISGSLTRSINQARATFFQNAGKIGVVNAINNAKGIDVFPFFQEKLNDPKLSLQDRNKLLTKVFMEFDKLPANFQQKTMVFFNSSQKNLTKLTSGFNYFKSTNAQAFNDLIKKLDKEGKLLRGYIDQFLQDAPANDSKAVKTKSNETGIGYSPTLAAQIRGSAGEVQSKGSNTGSSAMQNTLDQQMKAMENILKEGIQKAQGFLDKAQIKKLATASQPLIENYNSLQALVKSI